MSRTTPPRPDDIAAAFPQLAPLARTATRLHPRPGEPTRNDSSAGGPLLWPEDEPWPYCTGPHEPDGLPASTPADQLLLHRLRTVAHARPGRGASYTPEEKAVVWRLRAGRPWPDGPVALVPVAQLYTRDVPDLRPPGDADLLQILWCPFPHAPDHLPRTRLVWRTARTVTAPLDSPPEPEAVHINCFPHPCLLHPEQVVEYPSPLELEPGLMAEVEAWSAARKAGAPRGSVYREVRDAYYHYELSVAPGWKAGGWAPWGLTDPRTPGCAACGTPMEPLVTIASGERGGDSWLPYEDRGPESPAAYPDPATPVMVTVGRGDSQQLWGCPADPSHPHAQQVQ